MMAPPSGDAALAGPPARAAAPSHPALAGGWSVWRWVWLRGAGFAADQVLRLATERSAELAAGCAVLEEEERAARARALAACEAALDSARGAESGALAKIIRRLRAGEAPAASAALPGDVAAALEATLAAARELADRRAALDQVLAGEQAAARAFLQDVARSGPMREAMVWQNRRFVRGSVDAFLRRSPDEADSKMREYERVLATYLQRYCVKNETIGFFGPVGWARWSADEGGIVTGAPAPLIARRTLFFEHWAVDALATRLAQDPELRPHLAPRRMPGVRLDGEVISYGLDRTATLPVPFARALAACDGETTAAELAERLARDPDADVADLDEVLGVLDELVSAGLITWTLELPTAEPRPERLLAERLARIPAAAPRERAAGALARLESARDQVAAAAGDPDRLDRALDRLEIEFRELTGAEASRRAGETYAGRGLVFEDCLRGGEIRLGADLRGELAGPLELLLTSARWYTHEIGRRYRALFGEVHRELVRETGQARVSLLRFRQRIDPHFASGQQDRAAIPRAASAELHARWSAILGDVAGERRVTRAAAALRDAVAEAFAAPCPGWPGARYHSPDVIVAARDAGAVAAGAYRLVLGELHVGMNTILSQVALQQHPDPDELIVARERDRVDVGITPVESRDNASRADNVPVARRDLHLELGATRSFRPRDQVLAVADLVVEELGGQLVVSSLDGRARFDVIAFFDQDLTFAAAGGFGILAAGPHVPRVTIDRLVLSRERWRFDAAALELGRASTPRDRMIAAQRWRARHGLPRFLFVRVPAEPKPLYVDLASSSYVELLAKWTRAAPTVDVSEMLPTHDEAWLADADGRRYTSELRMAAVDPMAWRPPGEELA